MYMACLERERGTVWCGERWLTGGGGGKEAKLKNQSSGFSLYLLMPCPLEWKSLPGVGVCVLPSSHLLVSHFVLQGSLLLFKM